MMMTDASPAIRKVTLAAGFDPRQYEVIMEDFTAVSSSSPLKNFCSG